MNNFNQNQNVSEQLKMEGVPNGVSISAESGKLPVGQQVFQGQSPQEQRQVQQKNHRQSNPQKLSGVHEITDEMKHVYESIFNSYGEDSANNWLKQQIMNSHINLHADNEAVIKEIQAKYAEVYTIPAVQKALNAYIEMDLNPSVSLREQGFHEVMEHMASIYKAGYEDALSLKTQNDSAKSRMSSAVNSAMPHQQSNKIFSRSEIRSMSPDVFVKNEKAIFEQLGRGLIK